VDLKPLPLGDLYNTILKAKNKNLNAPKAKAIVPLKRLG